MGTSIAPPGVLEKIGLNGLLIPSSATPVNVIDNTTPINVNFNFNFNLDFIVKPPRY
jgi:hypothetical protein